MTKASSPVPKRARRGLLMVLVVLFAAAGYHSTAELKQYASGFTIQTFFPDSISAQNQANNNNTYNTTFARIADHERTVGKQDNDNPQHSMNDARVELSNSSAEVFREAETQQHYDAALLLGNQETIIHQAFLQYAKHLQANTEQVEFNANFTLSSTGEACFAFVVNNTNDQCSFPYIRVRLSGSALVHVPLYQRLDDGSRFDGCALLPVPGIYFIDANLIHCRMNTKWKRLVRVRLFVQASGQPVTPDLNVTFTPHEVVMPPFVRNASSLRQPLKSAYPYHAWVFAPLCPDSDYRVAESCAKTQTPRFLPTKFQLDKWLQNNNFSSFFSPEVDQRFDDYMWLPVNPTNGSIDYEAEHSVTCIRRCHPFCSNRKVGNTTKPFCTLAQVMCDT